jgi:BirA family biotin operon repressor/biotin-[acetyl-CoA-carboxylase] ligase
MNNLLPQLFYIETCGSTNDEAFHLLESSPACLVWSTHQVSGRGSRGRTWLGEKGSMLALSLGLQQPFPSSKQNYPYALFAGLWVIETLLALFPKADLALKWPNDILLNGKKLCGILCESRWMGQSCRVVLGVGINLKSQALLTDLPKGYASLDQLQGEAVEAKSICGHLAQKFPAAVKSYRSLPALKQAWVRLSWIPLHSLITVQAEGTTHRGTFAGLGVAGEMLLKSDHGMITIHQVCDDFQVLDTNS